MSNGPSIEVLDPLVAQKIAAGEVVERPSGVLRELLDNSLDASARSIEVHLVGGGTEELRVIDNGAGMGPDDLSRCYLPHATSKISTLEDLTHVRSLGFRGEALNAVASVSRLSIVSSAADGHAHELRVDGGSLVSLDPTAAPAGTVVTVRDLFYNVPARREFLKRGSSESASARAVFLDKALPFPGVSFRLIGNGQLRSFLPPGTLLERIAGAYPERTEPARLQLLTASGDGFSLQLVAGEPGAHRKDRKQLQVFVNRRRIWEYALVQAVEYAYRDYLHGGLYPTAYLFIEIQPELVDFNIHPAKREVRFRNLPEIHRRVVSVLSSFLAAFDNRSVLVERELPLHEPGYHGSGDRSSTRVDSGGSGETPTAFDLSRRFSPADGGFVAETGGDPNDSYGPIERAEATATDPFPRVRYLGQVMDLFLVVEVDDTLYLVDQHAAHERVIYDRLRSGSGGQELLFPVALEVHRNEEQALSEQLPLLSRLGIELEKTPEGWELTSIPAMLSLSPEEIAALLMDLVNRPDDFERQLFASLSCRSAVMDGDRISTERAMQIIDGVLGLPNARCPHGRPVWISFSKDHLASMVGRT